MKQRDLLDGDSPVRKPPAKYTDTQRLTAHYRSEYQKKFGEMPVIDGADGKILKELIGQFGYEKVRGRLSDYLAWDDEYVANAGYPLTLFRRSWNRLTAQLQKRALRSTDVTPNCAHRPRCRTPAEHTKRRIADMKR